MLSLIKMCGRVDSPAPYARRQSVRYFNISAVVDTCNYEIKYMEFVCRNKLDGDVFESNRRVNVKVYRYPFVFHFIIFRV